MRLDGSSPRSCLKRLWPAAVVAALAAGCFAQTPPATPGTAPAAAPAALPAPASSATANAQPSLLDQVVFVGASATAGFGVIIPDPDGKQRSAPLPLAAGFAGAVTNFAPGVTPRNFGSSLFFLSPGVTGGAQVDRALELKPTLVVALDFLFWYAYGNDDGKGGSLAKESDRLAKLELGFRQLERIDTSVPIVVGDLPDMSAAVGKMLSEQQMPAKSTLEALNASLQAWAKGRPNVILFPLSDLVTKLNGGETLTLGGIEFAKSKGRLIQSDELHPTARGSLAMSLRIAELLNERLGERATLTLVPDETTATRRAHAAALDVLAKRGGAANAKPKAPAAPTAPVAPPTQEGTTPKSPATEGVGVGLGE